MNDFEKTLIGIIGLGVAAGAAVGAAWFILELSKKYPEPAKAIVNGVNELANLAADNISNHHDDKPAIEVLKKGKDALAEIAKHELDEYHNQSRRLW